MKRPLTAREIDDAVRFLRNRLRTRVTAWGELAVDIANVPAAERTARLQRLDRELQQHLLPHLELEETLFDDEPEPMIALEHRAIRRAVTRLHHVATAGEVHPYLVQSTVAALHVVVEDHLRRDELIVLPELVGT
ncbi:hypothetical protein [Egicoccus halophilus]|uniref:Hemerythrin HHE cation binding domain-containing protein n=1 Tax=Egicoccus halophilus TaxID=1670830 RepID=A0A8J3AC07_9ACTN|nr:hypothetical protein [Egicoccus halophilus]GGI08150.1 hypothetical protein GCM10011354_27650 [Egicoccus halophilus]